MANPVPPTSPPSSPRLLRRGAAGGHGALRVPTGYEVQTLSDPSSREAVTAWVRSSPDHTLYHLWPYIEFTRAQNGLADLYLISREGSALLGLTVHFWTGMGVDSGYSGVVFPATDKERQLRRSVAALGEVLRANDRLQFRFHQSLQALAYDDIARGTLLERLIEGEGLRLEAVYGRLLPLDHLPAGEEIPASPGRTEHALALDSDWLVGPALGAYDPDARNQIRQAVRRGLTVEYVRAVDAASRADAYASFQQIHEESWRRTGLVVKLAQYWLDLSDLVTQGAAATTSSRSSLARAEIHWRASCVTPTTPVRSTGAAPVRRRVCERGPIRSVCTRRSQHVAASGRGSSSSAASTRARARTSSVPSTITRVSSAESWSG